jgi:hypothetical protein
MIGKSILCTLACNCGSKLHEIKADNIKILFVGHGDEEFKKSGDRTANNIVNYVVTLRGVLPAQSSMPK